MMAMQNQTARAEAQHAESMSAQSAGTQSAGAESKPAPPSPERTTHFGYQTVDAADKARLVGEVFRSVAGRYDLMNDLMSFGAHRGWKRFAASQSALRHGDAALDAAGGSGDMAKLLARQVGCDGRVVLTDINAAMLAEGKSRMLDAGLANMEYALADAEQLPFDDDTFDCVSMAFGLRNVTHPREALASLHRVLRPGGRLLVLEFSKPLIPWLNKIYDGYSFAVIPALGKLVAGDESSYRYLVESIRRHPDQHALKALMRGAGFDEVKIHNLSAGIIALHIGFKY